MKTLEITVSITLQVADTGDKTYDCLVAVEEAKDLLNTTPGYELLRGHRVQYGQPLVKITKIKMAEKGWVVGSGDSRPLPLNIETPIE